MSIWYVDDDLDDAEVFCEAVREVAPTILCKVFSKGDDLLSEIGFNCPDFIFLDYRMHKLNGVQIVHKIHKTECFKKTKIVMYSSFMRDQEIEACKKLGVYDCIGKSANFQTLCEYLRSVLL